MSLERAQEQSEDKTTVRRRTKRTRELIEAQEKQRETLRKQHDELQKELEEHQAEQRKLGEREALGMVVSHKKFGRGTVTKAEGKYIDVTFDRLTKTFVLPGAIAGGFLVPEDESLIEYYKRGAAIRDRIQKTELQLRSNGFAEERVSEQIERLEGRA